MRYYGYPNLHRKWGWECGVHRAPAGYEHPWLAVGRRATLGAWSRDHARELLRELDALDRKEERGGEE